MDGKGLYVYKLQLLVMENTLDIEPYPQPGENGLILLTFY